MQRSYAIVGPARFRPVVLHWKTGKVRGWDLESAGRGEGETHCFTVDSGGEHMPELVPL